MTLHEFFSELLRSFHLRSSKGRAPTGNPDLSATVCQSFTRHKIAFLASDAEIDSMSSHPRDQSIQIMGINLSRSLDLMNRFTSRETRNLRGTWRLLKRTNQRMFTTTFSDDTNLHEREITNDPVLGKSESSLNPQLTT